MLLTNRLILLLVLVGLLSACSSSGGFFSDKAKEYRSQREEVDNLEIPPDLSSSAISDSMVIPTGSSASYSEYTAKRQGGGRAPGASNLGSRRILPEFEGIRVERDGNQRWLVIDASPESVWPEVVAFWRQNGLLLVEQDPTIGVMTTDWLESRADIEQGVITEFLRKALDSIYTSATRDQFRVRLEPGQTPGTTELYLTHRGMVEKLVENVSGQADTTYWTPRPNEPETEAAMLRSLMVHLGLSEEQAETSLAQQQPESERARLVETSQTVELIINEGFARAWRLTGVALDRVGFAVEDRDRSQGVYFVRYKALEGKKKQGFFSKLAFWRSDEIDDQNQYRVKLEEQTGITRVSVENQEAVRLNTETASRLLTLLHEQIR